MGKRQRRSFSPEFKAEAIKVVRESGKSAGTVARELDLAETALRRWVAQGAIDAGHGPNGALSTDERAELAKKTVAFFRGDRPSKWTRRCWKV